MEYLENEYLLDEKDTGGQLPPDDDEKDTGGQLPPDDDEK